MSPWTLASGIEKAQSPPPGTARLPFPSQSLPRWDAVTAVGSGQKAQHPLVPGPGFRAPSAEGRAPGGRICICKWAVLPLIYFIAFWKLCPSSPDVSCVLSPQSPLAARVACWLELN